MRLVMISDTHGQHGELKIPDGDCLIHAGDFTGYDSPEALDAFADWFRSQPHRHKVLIAGNHDRCFQQQPTVTKAKFQGWVHYLQDSGCELEGIRIWGSPWTPRFFDFSFMLARQGEAIKERWQRIPLSTQLLITHGPAQGKADLTSTGIHVGCEALQQRLQHLPELQLHVCGHIHEGYGFYPASQGGYATANASSCRWADPGMNPPLVLDFFDLTTDNV